MIPQVPGKIYLADQRGLLETSQFQRQSTFNFGAYQQEYKEPFGRLYGLNEEWLAGGQAVEFVVEHDSYVVLLPITGGVEFSTGGGASGPCEAEQVTTIAAPASTVLRLQNPYAGEVVGLLHLWVRATALLQAGPVTALTTVFDADLLADQLCELVSLRVQNNPPTLPDLPFRLSLGRFMGRHEAVYKVEAGNTVFAFIVAGAFELEGRLMHEKDGVALWNVPEFELEALSNHALVLVVELA